MGNAQKQVSQVFDANNISEIKIYADEIFQIKISTSGNEKITVTTISEGEYYDNISLDAEVQENLIIFTSRFPEILQGGFDKLSAHKVFSVEVDLKIPKDLLVSLESNIASVIASGEYENLQILLNSGYCKLENFKGNGLINTYSGSVDISTQNAVIDAVSRSGMVSIPSHKPGKYLIKIQSNTGDIKVQEN